MNASVGADREIETFFSRNHLVAEMLKTLQAERSTVSLIDFNRENPGKHWLAINDGITSSKCEMRREVDGGIAEKFPAITLEGGEGAGVFFDTGLLPEDIKSYGSIEFDVHCPDGPVAIQIVALDSQIDRCFYTREINTHAGEQLIQIPLSFLHHDFETVSHWENITRIGLIFSNEKSKLNLSGARLKKHADFDAVKNIESLLSMLPNADFKISYSEPINGVSTQAVAMEKVSPEVIYETQKHFSELLSNFLGDFPFLHGFIAPTVVVFESVKQRHEFIKLIAEKHVGQKHEYSDLRHEPADVTLTLGGYVLGVKPADGKLIRPSITGMYISELIGLNCCDSTSWLSIGLQHRYQLMYNSQPNLIGEMIEIVKQNPDTISFEQILGKVESDPGTYIITPFALVEMLTNHQKYAGQLKKLFSHFFQHQTIDFTGFCKNVFGCSLEDVRADLLEFVTESDYMKQRAMR